MMRATWALAVLAVAAALLALAWPKGADAPRVADSGATATAARPVEPVPAAAVPGPIGPAVVPTATAGGYLEELLGGSLAAPVATGTPEVRVGAPAVVERLDDRTMRVDGMYLVRGSGSERDPYLITWELLASASASVDAAAGRFELPGRVADLRGAWVRISGYWAPPLQVRETRELMLMLNKWDGCCIGLPPTPFDSIEVTLDQPMGVEGQHLFRFGTVTGRLEVDPFVAGTFLLGLYRLQQATMEASS